MADYYQIGEEPAADRTATVLRLSGELDINARDELRATLTDALAEHEDVTVDLSAVTFIDSEALGALIDGYNSALDLSATFRVVGATGAVARVLTVSGSQAVFDGALETPDS
ncbi:STAS domain-containing protein [Paractinoplanes lichenicola]|uniref:Anti-sigma factor antagonist n=1 Tax=Paractinoplanes lichenicola TaxID=2802976 RepID=A0ABS1VSD6_9ACTN|nr:STAS domain-containing protein [Actinoplanes lichenicola]MBL7257325.1 STAS domain-containing protein [Actinoplanes lichenicola]